MRPRNEKEVFPTPRYRVELEGDIYVPIISAQYKINSKMGLGDYVTYSVILAVVYGSNVISQKSQLTN